MLTQDEQLFFKQDVTGSNPIAGSVKNMSEKKTEGQRITDLINSGAILTVPSRLIKHPKVTSMEAYKEEKEGEKKKPDLH